MSGTEAAANFTELTADIVSAYVCHHSVPATDLPILINQVHTALLSTSGGSADGYSDPTRPAVSIKRSVTPDYIVCLEDGKKFKSLKRHLRVQYNMTPEQYRTKWGLGRNYPMVAPNYAATRSRLAKQIGLGQSRPSRSK